VTVTGLSTLKPFLDCALDLIEANPAVTADKTPQGVAKEILVTLRGCMRLFNWDAFTMRTGDAMSLWDCRTDEGLMATKTQLITLGSYQERSLYLMPLVNHVPTL